MACLRSHVLRACCNFEAKQANSSISLFGRRQNKRPGPMWYQFNFNQLHFRLELSIRDKSHLLEEYFGDPFLSLHVRMQLNLKTVPVNNEDAHL